MLATPAPLRSKIPGLPSAVEEVVQMALAKDPAQRFMRVQAFANAFEQAVQSAQAGQMAQSYPSFPPGVGSSPNPGNTSSGQSSQSTYVIPPSPPRETSSGNFAAMPPGQLTPNFANMPTSQSNFGGLPPGQPSPSFAGMPTSQSFSN